MTNSDTVSPVEIKANLPKLKIGLIVDSKSASQHIFELVQWCQGQSTLTINHLLITDAKSASGHAKTVNFRSLCFSAIVWLETLLLKRAGIHASNDDHNLDTLIPETIRIKTETTEYGHISTYSEIELDKIKSLQLDVLLISDSGTLHADILKTVTIGVVSLGYSDGNDLSTSPSGFWEVFFKLDFTGFTISGLNGDPHIWKNLISGRIRTQYYYLLNSLHIRHKCLHYMKETLSKIALNRQFPECSSTMLKEVSTHGMPSLHAQAKYVASLGLRLIGRLARSKLKMDFKWGVAFKKNTWQNLAMETAIKIPNPRNHFLADPFVISESGRDYCFLEDYDYSSRKGHIAVYQLHDDHAECMGNALIEPYHLSFPYIFYYKSELYMCPETSRNRQIRVYKCLNFPLQWQFHAVLMDDVSAADTMLFERDGRWWMLTNMDVTETGDYCTELSIYWADSPLSSHWTAHPANPVFIDAAKGRNAGLLFDDNIVYRVAQKQSFDFYGKAFSINRIDQLDEKIYRETEIRSVQANFFPKINGTHHMHSNDNATVFDFI